VSYISEVPVWKSTYRIVFPHAASGDATVQGWAVVDTPSEQTGTMSSYLSSPVLRKALSNRSAASLHTPARDSDCHARRNHATDA